MICETEQGYILRLLDKEDINSLMELNNQLFPVKYGKGFYCRLLVDTDVAAFVLMDRTQVIGTCTCRIEASDDVWGYITGRKVACNKKTANAIK